MNIFEPWGDNEDETGNLLKEQDLIKITQSKNIDVSEYFIDDELAK